MKGAERGRILRQKGARKGPDTAIRAICDKVKELFRPTLRPYIELDAGGGNEVCPNF